ncbi:hypothetical protein [Streptomyces sp. NPDC001492]
MTNRRAAGPVCGLRAPHVAGGDVGPAVDAVRPADALEGGEGERLVGVRVRTNVERLAGLLDAAVRAQSATA